MIKNIFATIFYLALSTQALAFQHAREAQYRFCSESNLHTCLKNPDTLAQPFIMQHEGPIKDRPVALLIHGLTDSAHSMEDVGLLLFKKDFNVVSILLSGHGTKAEDLLQGPNRVRLEDWQEDVRFGVSLASRYGQKLILGGYSTGGALAVDYALKNPQAVHSMILMAPALSISHLSFAACNIAAVMPWAWTKDDGVEDTHPTKYKKGASNAVCELYRQTLEFPRQMNLTMPIFTVLTSADTTIEFAKTYELVRKFPNPNNVTMVYRPAGFENGSEPTAIDEKSTLDSKRTRFVEVFTPVSHGSLTMKPRKGREDANFDFAAFENRLNEFLQQGL